MRMNPVVFVPPVTRINPLPMTISVPTCRTSTSTSGAQIVNDFCCVVHHTRAPLRHPLQCPTA